MCFRGIFCWTLALAGLMCAGAVAAGALDGGEIRFQGEVTDDGPRWTWQVAAPDQTWAVDTARARAAAGQLVFDLQDRGSLAFLEGRLHEVAGQGGPGFSPQVTFSSQGQPFLLPAGESTTRGRFQAAVPVTDPETGHPVGELSFTVEQGLAAAFRPGTDGGFPPGMALLTGGVVTQLPAGGLSQGVMNRLSALLLMTPGWGDGMSAAFNGQTLPQNLLTSPAVPGIAAAYASAFSGFQLTLPAADTPAYWQARLSVTVTVQ
ncbi:F4 family fimbrial subunit [Citrobacter portucalensis]|uniref:F4 family fimbrial subunit n=1 Tax=Citrobacter portucalensis TaxID=1639133 RepID=UPI00288B22C2|nr:fimbrial protein [Citrobacter portucalensis]WNI84217.1 fimbrial protein [Citrobacter portucalensis]